MTTKKNVRITAPKISTHLWFDKEAVAAAKFYVSIFPNSKIVNISKITDTPSGDCDLVQFILAGKPFYAISAGPYFKFSEAISLMVHCKTQKEIDYYWQKLSAHPKSEQCGWLKDKFGLSWQIVPTLMDKVYQSKDKKKIQRVTQAFLQMKKFDLATLEQAAKKPVKRK